MNKEKIIEVMARALNVSRRRFPNKQNATFEGCKVKPTAEQYRDAEAALQALLKELPEIRPTEADYKKANEQYDNCRKENPAATVLPSIQHYLELNNANEKGAIELYTQLLDMRD